MLEIVDNVYRVEKLRTVIGIGDYILKAIWMILKLLRMAWSGVDWLIILHVWAEKGLYVIIHEVLLWFSLICVVWHIWMHVVVVVVIGAWITEVDAVAISRWVIWLRISKGILRHLLILPRLRLLLHKLKKLLHNLIFLLIHNNGCMQILLVFLLKICLVFRESLILQNDHVHLNLVIENLLLHFTGHIF